MNIVNKIRKIKESRLTNTEKNLLEILRNLDEFTTDEHPDSIFYKYKGNIIIEKSFKFKKISGGSLYFQWEIVGDKKILKYTDEYNDFLIIFQKMTEEYLGWEHFSQFHTAGKSLDILQSNLKTNNKINTIK